MEWKEVRLGDLTVDGKGSYGIGAPAVEFSKEKYTYLRITDINDDGTLNFFGLKSVDDEDAEKYLLKENDIVFARTGASTGRTYFYEKHHGKFVYAGFLIKYSLDPQKVNPRILKYYTHSKIYYDWVSSFDTGGTRGNINAKTFADMPICLPERSYQDRIVSILSSLDRKIELNNKINAQLEEMAQAIFKSWFVDFEPFKDGKFVESELGLIPEGWRVGTLGEIASINKKSINPQKTPNTLYTHYSLPAFDEGRVPHTQFGDEIMSNKILFAPKTTLLSKLNPHIKRIWFVNEIKKNSICSTEFIPIKANNEQHSAFVHCLINSDWFYNRAISSVNGATVSHQRIHPEDIMNIKYATNTNIIKEYSTFTYPILTKIEQNIEQNLHLAQLRDTLLPKLMNGEIEI